jgi:hypothetical protein
MPNKLQFYNDSDVGYDHEWYADELMNEVKIEEQIEQDEEELKKVQ